MDIDFIRLLHLSDRLVVCVKQVDQLSPVHEGKITEHRRLVYLQIRGEFGNVHFIGQIVRKDNLFLYFICVLSGITKFTPKKVTTLSDFANKSFIVLSVFK